MQESPKSEYQLLYCTSDGTETNVGSVYYDSCLHLRRVTTTSDANDVQLTRPRIEDNYYSSYKKAKLFQAEEYDESVVLSRFPTTKREVVPKAVGKVTDNGIEKEIFEISKEEFGDFIYQGPEFHFKLMKVHKCDDYPAYIVITTFVHTLADHHPCWKLYRFSSELNDEIAYKNNKHSKDKVEFRISNVEIPPIGSFYKSIQTNRGSCYSTAEIYARTGNEEEEEDDIE